METIFYILIYLTSICNGGNVLLIDNSYTLPTYSQSCSKSDVRVVIVDSIQDIIDKKNKTVGQSMFMVVEDPDKIVKVTMKDGKVISEKPVSIVPITQYKKKMVETTEREIVGYEIR